MRDLLIVLWLGLLVGSTFGCVLGYFRGVDKCGEQEEKPAEKCADCEHCENLRRMTRVTKRRVQYKCRTESGYYDYFSKPPLYCAQYAARDKEDTRPPDLAAEADRRPLRRLIEIEMLQELDRLEEEK